MSEADWLDILEVGLRELRPEWTITQSMMDLIGLDWTNMTFMGGRAYADCLTPCLMIGPWDAKVVVVGDVVLVFFGCHRFQHRIGLDDANLFEKIVECASVDDRADAPS